MSLTAGVMLTVYGLRVTSDNIVLENYSTEMAARRDTSITCPPPPPDQPFLSLSSYCTFRSLLSFSSLPPFHRPSQRIGKILPPTGGLEQPNAPTPEQANACPLLQPFPGALTATMAAKRPAASKRPCKKNTTKTNRTNEKVSNSSLPQTPHPPYPTKSPWNASQIPQAPTLDLPVHLVRVQLLACEMAPLIMCASPGCKKGTGVGRTSPR